MKFKYLLEIAFRNLWFRVGRTVITIAGVVIGIGAIVFLVSLGYGLQKMTLAQIGTMKLLEVLDVYSEKSTIVRMNDKEVERISNLAHVEATTPLISLGGKIKRGDKETEAIIYGAERRYFDFSETSLSTGAGFTGDLNEAILNTAALDLLGVKNPRDVLGETIKTDVVLTKSVAPNLKKERETEKNLKVKVVGVVSENGSAAVYLPLFKLTSKGVENYQLLKVKIDSKEWVEQLRFQIENFGFRVDWIGDTIAQVNQVFNLFKIILGAFGGIALLVSALGIFNTLTVSLMERTREIGVMQVLGMRGKDIQKLFLIEAGLIGAVGGTAGTLVGYGVGQLLNYLLQIFATRAGAEAVAIFYTPLPFAILVGLFALLIGLFTGIYPALRARHIHSLDALRYE